MSKKTVNTSQRLADFKRLSGDQLDFAITLTSNKPGPHLVFFGAIHGHEVAGVEALWKFYKFVSRNNIKLKRGKISLVIGNPVAYQQGVRLVEENMNRAFLADLNKTVEGKRIYSIRKFFDLNPDITGVFDFHSVSTGDFKAIIYPNTHHTQTLVQNVSLLESNFSFDLKFIPGLLITEALQRGYESLAFECGNNHDPNTEAVAYSMLLKVVESYDLIESENLPKLIRTLTKPKVQKNYEIIDAVTIGPNFNWLIPQKNLQTDFKLQRHQVYACSDDGPLLAPKDCVLVMPDKNPSPNDRDAGFLATLEIV